MDEGAELEPVVFDGAVSEFDELFVALAVELSVDVSLAFGADFSLGLFESLPEFFS